MKKHSLMLLMGVEYTGSEMGFSTPFSLTKASKHRHTLFRFIFLASASASERI
jgi:hypothetical protein